MASRVIAFILSFIIPPAGVFLARGFGSGFIVNLVLTIIAVGIFFGLYAGPGLTLFGLAVLHALILVVLPRRQLVAATAR